MTDGELSAAIAIRLGWKYDPTYQDHLRWRVPKGTKGWQGMAAPKPYSTDIAACFNDLVPKFKDGFNLNRGTIGKTTWHCNHWDEDADLWSVGSIDDTIPRAICREFLKLESK